MADRLCTGCEHPMARHVRNVEDMVICLCASSVSLSGVMGVPYVLECDCLNYASKAADIALAKQEEEDKRQMALVDGLVEHVKGVLPTNEMPPTGFFSREEK